MNKKEKMNKRINRLENDISNTAISFRQKRKFVFSCYVFALLQTGMNVLCRNAISLLVFRHQSVWRAVFPFC